jgi:hypothetical protein
MPDFEALLEAEKRGILPESMGGLLAEARTRGLLPNNTAPPPTPDFSGQAQGQQAASEAPAPWKRTVSQLGHNVLPAVGMGVAGLVGGAAATPETLGIGTIPAAVASGALGYAGGEQAARVLDNAMGVGDTKNFAGELYNTAGNIAKGAAYEMTGQATGPALGLAGSALKAGFGKIVPKGVEQKLYGSVIKPPMNNEWVRSRFDTGGDLTGPEITNMYDRVIQRGLDTGAQVNRAGVAQTIQGRDNIGRAIENSTQAATDAGLTASTEGLIFRGLRSLRARPGGSNANAYKQSLDNAAQEFRAHGQAIDPNTLLKIKQDIYKEVGPGSYGKYTNVDVEAKKGLADASMKAVEGFAPEIKGLNQAWPEYKNLQTALEKAIPRIGNNNIVSLSDYLTGTVGGVIGGAASGGLGAVASSAGAIALKRLLTSPDVKVKLAIAINAARKAQSGIGAQMPKTGAIVKTGLIMNGQPIYDNPQ